MRYPEGFIDDVRSRVPLSAMVSRRVKLKRSGRTWQGLCPFHKEKTASFNVDDTRGTFHCFGCEAHGDAIEWIKRTEGKGFVEAVEALAEEAGIPLPAQDDQAVRREVHRLSIVDLLDKAASAYAQFLKASPTASAYVADRAVSPAEVARFGLGFAPDNRSTIKAALPEVPPGLLNDAGLIVTPEDGPPRDRFRNRIMFPIRDLRGKVVGFGGRGLGDVTPKYLNSPEGPAFDKGTILYNAHAARQPAHDGAPLLVVEGYFDVLAAVRAGFPATVATMGTSVTPGHLALLWRMSDAPVMVFDGDGAGRRAAMKTIRQAMPLLYAGRSIRIAMLPTGEDPDSLVRSRGADALRQAVEGAMGLADAFWRQSIEGRSLTSPEAQAALEKDMADAFKAIPDDMLRRRYERDMRDRVSSLSSRLPVIRSNGFSNHSASPGAIRLTHPIERPDLSLKEAILLAQIVSSPADVIEAAGDMLETPRGISERTRRTIAELIHLISSLPEAETAALMEAIKGKDLEAEVERAIGVCHGAGINRYG